MKRSNRFELRPRSENERAVLVRWLDASAALWNETTYARRTAFFSSDSIWDVDTGSLEGRYKSILSSSVAQQVIRKNTEAWTSRECPACGEREETIRHGDSLTCSCGFEGHADLVASETFLTRQKGIESTEAGPMARPVYLKWDNHDWRDDPSPPSILETTTNEAYTNRSTARCGNVALGASQIG